MDNGIFQASFPNYTVHLFSRPSRAEDAVDYVLQILDDDGAVIEEATDVTMKRRDYDPETLELFAKLYRNARRKALGVDQAVDSILAVLTEGDDPPPPPTDEDVPLF